jgi:RNA-directed DNA polymerase
MLNIGSVGLLARRLSTTTRRLIDAAERASSYYEDLILVDPARPDKVRDILNPIGPLRRFQRRLHDLLLAPVHRPSRYSHGGIRGRNVKSNASPHLRSTFVYTTDIANFYPSIHYTRVYTLFTDYFECSPDVARICTKLCTHRHHLPLGLITSPILADCFMKRADFRIGRMCERSGLAYSRYVDDITISASYPIESGSVPKLVTEILQDFGLRTNPKKEDMGRFSEGRRITKLEIRRGRPDVSREYLADVNAQIDAAGSFARGGDWQGTYYTPSQIYGRIAFISWINPGRRRALMRRYRVIDWAEVESAALARGLVAPRKKLLKKPATNPNEYCIPASAP